MRALSVDQGRRLAGRSARPSPDAARERYDQATADLDPPLALVDLSAYDRNAADMTRRAALAGNGGHPVRVATKLLRELIAYHARPDGSSNAPMRTAMSHIDLGLIRARHGDLDEAVEHGLTAFSLDRKTEASLLSHAADLDQLLSDRYPDERLADEFHQRYRDARTALRHKTHADS